MFSALLDLFVVATVLFVAVGVAKLGRERR
jgi:hypothetical protein